MKKMKKIVALLLAAVMVLGMSLTTFAATGTNDSSGKITITNPVKEQTYSAYQILKLESYNTDLGAYTYTATVEWEDFVKSAAIKDIYLTTKGEYVSWVGATDASRAEAFAKLAMTYAKENGLTAQGSVKASSTAAVEITGLNLGYYLVDSTLGALCSLNTTHPSVSITEKNTPPVPDKKVKNETGNYVEEVTAKIGDTEEFRSKVVIYKGTENLVYHDYMQNTLDYVEGSVKVYYAPMSNGDELDKGADASDANADYYVVESSTHEVEDPTDASKKVNCTFEVVFTKKFLESVTAVQEIEIVYNAVLTENALIKDEANVNYARIEYGENGETEWDSAKVYSLKFELVKTNMNDEVINGAEFKLYDAKTDGNQIHVKATDVDTQGRTVYRVTTDSAQSDVIKAGRAVVEGLDVNKAYYLEETKQPEGYNKLTERVLVTLTDNNLATVVDNVYESGGVKVENLKGTMMPATGGIGTTIFYVTGAALVLVAVVVLVSRKRMSVEE